MELRAYLPLTARLSAGESVTLSLAALGGVQQNIAVGLLTRGLTEVGALAIESAALVALQELLANAELAVFFDDFVHAGELDADSAPTRAQFKAILKEDLPKIRMRARRQAPRVHLSLRIHAGELQVEVHSAAVLFPFQEARIRQQLELAAAAPSLAALKSHELATECGPGQGLVIAAMALRSAGGALQFEKSAEGARFRFALRAPVGDEAALDATLLRELEGIPSFPENIRKLRELCESNDSSLKQIVDFLGREPNLAGGILRLANSGGFAGGKIGELAEAVRIVGLRNISQLLLQIGALQILSARYPMSEELLEHPVRVAIFARSLARRHKRLALADAAYVGGLLHDIGKVVLLSVMAERPGYDFLSVGRNRRSVVAIEELAWGIGHARVGQLLAARWKFPEALQTVIAWHHSPARAPADHRELTDIVYLANAMVDCLDGDSGFYAIDPGALERFNLSTEEAFLMLAAALDQEARQSLAR